MGLEPARFTHCISLKLSSVLQSDMIMTPWSYRFRICMRNPTAAIRSLMCSAGSEGSQRQVIKLAENRGGKIFERDLPASRKKRLYSENLPWATSPMQDEGTEIRRIFMPILCVDIAAVHTF